MIKKNHKFYHLFKKINNIDEIEKECRKIFNKFPITVQGTASGKFSKYYQAWQFYKDSEQNLIQEIVSLVDSCLVEFKKEFPKKNFYYQFIQIVYSKDCRKLLCVPHKDAHCYDGQIHITVLGNGNISIWSDKGDNLKKRDKIYVENGSIWYINSSRFLHTINRYKTPTRGSSFERIEILVPIAGTGNQADEQDMLRAVSKDKDRFFYPDNKHFIHLKRKRIEYMLRAYRMQGNSNPIKPIGFIHNIKELRDYNLDKMIISSKKKIKTTSKDRSS